MDEGLSVRIGDSRILWLMELPKQTFEAAGVDDLESDGGLFVVLEDLVAGSLDILAKVASERAGVDLLEMMGAGKRLLAD